MKKTLLILAPVAMLALAACNKNETPAEGETAAAAKQASPPLALPPAITSSGTYRCADNTILYVDFLGANIAADIRIGDKTATAIRVSAPAAEAPVDGTAPVEASPPAPLKSADGEALLSGTGMNINVKLPGKGAQTCKSR